MAKRGIKDRFKEVVECRRVMEKEVVCNHALGSLEWMVTSLGKFEMEWIELTLAGLPSCWEPTTIFFNR